MIKTLYLRNFRKLEEAAIDFHPKVNGIFGANYKGKSTILIAIAVALAGPAWARGMNLVRRGQDNFEVQMSFVANGRDYRVVRTKSGAKLFEGDKLLANQQGNVNREISTIIGVPVESWLSLRFVRQKQAAAMFEAGAAKLNALVEELTGVRVISLVIDSLGNKAKDLTAKLEGSKSGLLPEGTLTETQEDLAEAKSVITRAEAEISQSTKLLDECSAAAANSKQLKRELEATIDQAGERSRAHAKAVRALELAEVQATAKLGTRPEGDVQALEDAYDTLTAKVQGLAKQLSERESAERRLDMDTRAYDADKAAVARVADKLAAVMEEGETYLDATGRLTAQVADLDGQITATQTDHSAADYSLRERQIQIKSLHEELESGVCQSCHRAFEGHDDAHRQKTSERIQTLQQEVSSLKDLVAKHATQLQTLRLDKAKADQELNTLHSLHQELGRAERELEQSRERKEAAEAAFSSFTALDPAAIGKEQAELTGQAAEARAQAKAVRQWESDSEKAYQALEAAKSELAKLPQPEDDAWFEDQGLQLMEATDEVSKMAARSGELAIDLGHWKSRLTTAIRTASTLGETLSYQQKLQERVEGLSDELTKVSGLRKFLRDNRSRYLQQAWTLLLARASAFADANTGGIITEILRTDDGKFQFIEQGELADTSDASGAQAAVMGIGVQMALAETLPTHLDVILADEPTADMDADHSMAAILGLTTQAKQLVLISHHRMDESVCDEVMEL